MREVIQMNKTTFLYWVMLLLVGFQLAGCTYYMNKPPPQISNIKVTVLNAILESIRVRNSLLLG